MAIEHLEDVKIAQDIVIDLSKDAVVIDGRLEDIQEIEAFTEEVAQKEEGEREARGACR